jgi:hypothetical protein
MARLFDLNGDNGCYFDRPPEKLVLEGYRRWTAGFETGCVTPWEMAWALYAETLGPVEGRHVLTELSHFTRTLWRCAACPLRAFPFGAHHLCREECLTLGLIAGLQNGDGAAADVCLNTIACRQRQGDVVEAAASFAAALGDRGQRLLPIPMAVIEDILGRPVRGAMH